MGKVCLATQRTEFDAFLYSIIRQEDSGAALSVLSLLARQGVDPWDEADELMRLPRDAAVTKLRDFLSASAGNSTQERDWRADAVALLELLPPPASIDAADPKPLWLGVVRRLERLKAASGAWFRNTLR